MSMIEVENVTMRFRLANDKIQSLKEYFIAVATKKLKYKELCVFSNLDFKIQKGEVVGIIGRNGAGKSTLLKIISGVLAPTEGSVKIYGNIVPMLELGSGFDIELSGRENIFLNGSILGYSKIFLEEKYDEILEFSELGDFIEEPIRNYSSGMLMRLAFSIATIVHPEILIVDEILSVGDEAFQRKSKRKMLELMGGGTTVLFVSHSIDQIKEMCSRVIWIENGKIEKDGDAKEVCDAYQKFLNPEQNIYQDQNANLRNVDAYKYLMDVLIVYRDDELSYYCALARKEQLLAANICAQELCVLDINFEVIKQYRLFIFLNCDYETVDLLIDNIKALNKSFIVECNDKTLINIWKKREPLVCLFSNREELSQEGKNEKIPYFPLVITERILQVSAWLRFDKNVLPYKSAADIDSEQELINYNRAVLEKRNHDNDGVRIGILIDYEEDKKSESIKNILKNYSYVKKIIVADTVENVMRKISQVDYIINCTRDRHWDDIVCILCLLVETYYCGHYSATEFEKQKIAKNKNNKLDFNIYEKAILKNTTLISGLTFSCFVKEKMSKSATFMVKQTSDLVKHPLILDRIVSMIKNGYDTSIMVTIFKEGELEYNGIKIPVVNKSAKYIFGSFDTVVTVGADEQSFIITYPNIQRRVYFVPVWEPEKYEYGDFGRIKSNQSYLPCVSVEFWTDSNDVQIWLKKMYNQDSVLLNRYHGE